MSFWTALSDLPGHHVVLLLAALGVAFAFEFVNGFHDTANAVATVIYTKALKSNQAVVWSAVWNFIGVHAGGIGVAYAIVHLLPVDLLVSIDSGRGLLMVLAILSAALMWNLGTWYLGLPASSSHTLIGAIMGVGVAHSLAAGKGWGGVNWSKAGEIGLSLLISPMIGFATAAALLFLALKYLRDPNLHRSPDGDEPPPPWVRAMLIGTCTGVSFAHGSNDGQKGMGLIMLILVGILPAYYAVDLGSRAARPAEVAAAAAAAEGLLGTEDLPPVLAEVRDRQDLLPTLKSLRERLAPAASFAALDKAGRWATRTELLAITRALGEMEKAAGSGPYTDVIRPFRRVMERPIEYVPEWVVMGVALALGVGTTVGWKRIVVTVAEKIGKSHLTYAQGACAELVAMTTIGLADLGGMPVSTTHVLSSGVAGTMWASQAGVQLATIRKIALAWVFTLPAAMLLSGGLFAFGGWIIP
jgi:phosphate/sulfate permease